MNSKLQIFISSTYTDLKAERQAAVEAILKAGHIPAGMELFTSGDRSQWEVIQRWITDSDIYMIILGGRYGSIEPDSGLSYTELEYDFAVQSGKPHFAVVIEEAALEKKVPALDSGVREGDHPKKLKAFRTKVLSKMSSFFSDPKDVKLAVLETVPRLAADYKLKGWVRAGKVPDILAAKDGVVLIIGEHWLNLSSRSEMVKTRGDTAIYSEPEWRITGFYIEGKNETGRKINNISGYLEFIESKNSLEILIDSYHPDQIYGIPANANFTVHAIFPRSTAEMEGATFEHFWRDFGAFNLCLDFDGIKILKHFSHTEIMEFIEGYIARLPKRSVGRPRVEWRSE
jgi:hypothetical protein